MSAGRRSSASVGSGCGSRASCSVRLLEVIQVQVAVAAGPDEIADREVRLLREDVGQQRIGGDVERHAEEDVGAALVDLAGQPAAGDVELEQRVAGRERHLVELADVPGADDDAARIGSFAQLLDRRARSGRPGGRPRSARRATAGRRPDRARPPRPPTRPRSSRPSPAASGRSSRRAGTRAAPRSRTCRCTRLVVTSGNPADEVEAQLLAEHRQRAGAGAVGLAEPVLADMAATGRGRHASQA